MIFTLLLVVTTIFDMLIYKKDVTDTLHMLLYAFVGAGRYLAYIGAALGLVTAMVVDYRLFKRKKRKKAPETDVS
ncbi:hypothetical protein [Ammoniphilus sp. 3BR4]|uniref:hypothetical protein n=1 Tax=Ammoniphilus sp. 3BR4 TaxID=3158265 RepID=UPI003466E9A8